MKISAVIPAYNSEKFIKDAIVSIQQQSHPVDELIVVDDGSTDNTENIVKLSDNNIVYIKQENKGPSAARNTGVHNASGDWVAFLDADDRWTPNKIEQQLETLDKYPDLELISSDMSEIDTDGETVTPSVLEKHQLLGYFREISGRPIPNALAQLMQKNFIPTGTVLAKRATLLDVGLFSEEIRFAEDLHLWARIAIKHPITCLPTVHLQRCKHESNATNSALPMLSDLVKVKTSIREIASDLLKKQGVNPDLLVTEAMNDLGYWHFSNDSIAEAKEIFRSSLKEKMTKRAIFYSLACNLPKGLIVTLREKKQLLNTLKG